MLLLRIGRWDEAQDALLSALKLESFRYAEASYNLGRVYAARGQSDLAAREWRRAIVVDPDHDAAKQALASVRREERIVVQPEPTEVKTAVAKKPAAVAAPAPANASKSLSLDATSFDFCIEPHASERGRGGSRCELSACVETQGGTFLPQIELSLHSLA